LIDCLSLKKLQDFPFPKYGSGENTLFITGVGMLNMAACVGYAFATYQNIVDKNTIFINFGTASSENLPQGTLYLISSVTKSGEKKSFYPDIFTKTDIPKATLESVDTPLGGGNIVKKGMLYDMEGYAFALTSNRFLQTHQYQLLKVVSDNLDDKLFSKKDIYEIVEKNIDSIDRFLKATNLDLEILTTKEKSLITSFVEDFRFSFTQKEELKELFYYYKLRDKSITKFLKNYDNILPKNKTDRNKIFKYVRQSLVTA